MSDSEWGWLVLAVYVTGALATALVSGRCMRKDPDADFWYPYLAALAVLWPLGVPVVAALGAMMFVVRAGGRLG